MDLNPTLVNYLLFGTNEVVDEQTLVDFQVDYLEQLNSLLMDVLSIKLSEVPELSPILDEIDKLLENEELSDDDLKKVFELLRKGTQVTDEMRRYVDGIITKYNFAIFTQYKAKLDEKGQVALADYMEDLADLKTDIALSYALHVIRYQGGQRAVDELASEMKEEVAAE